MLDYNAPSYYVARAEERQEAKALFPLKGIYDDMAMSFNESAPAEMMSSRNQEAEQISLVLYIRPECPYCQKVLRYLSSIGKRVPTKDIGTDRQALDELISIGGKRQVPCLFINGQPHYESDWIIDWLKQNKNLLPDA